MFHTARASSARMGVNEVSWQKKILGTHQTQFLHIFQACVRQGGVMGIIPLALQSFNLVFLMALNISLLPPRQF